MVQSERDGDLPVELSSIVATLDVLTHELTKTLSQEQTREVVKALCAKLLLIADDRRLPDRPFTR